MVVSIHSPTFVTIFEGYISACLNYMTVSHTVVMTHKTIHTDLQYKKKSEVKFIFGPSLMHQGNTQSQITLPQMTLKLLTLNLVHITF